MRKWIILILLVLVIPFVSANIIDDIYDIGVNIFTSKEAINDYEIRIEAQKETILNGNSGYIPLDITNLGGAKQINLNLDFEDEACYVKYYETYTLTNKTKIFCEWTAIKEWDDQNNSYNEYYKSVCKTIPKYEYEWVEVDKETASKSKKTGLSNKIKQSYRVFVECRPNIRAKYSVFAHQDLGITELDPIIQSYGTSWQGTNQSTIISGTSLNLSGGQTTGGFISVGYGNGSLGNNWSQAFIRYNFDTKPTGNVSDNPGVTLAGGAPYVASGEEVGMVFIPKQNSVIYSVLTQSGDIDNVKIVNAETNVTVYAEVGLVAAGAGYLEGNFTTSVSVLKDKPYYVIVRYAAGGQFDCPDNLAPSFPYNLNYMTMTTGINIATWTYEDRFYAVKRMYFSNAGGEGLVSVDVCYSDTNTTFSSCDSNVTNGAVLTNRTARYMQFVANISRTVTTINPGIYEFNVTYEPSKPDVTIVSPSNQTYVNASILLSYSCSNCGNLFYSTDNGLTNTSISSGIIINANEGGNSVILTGNNSVGQDIESVYYFVDSASPTLYVESPTNRSYTYRSIDLNVTGKDTNLDGYYYTIDGGSNVIFTPNITIKFTNGNINLNITVNDTSGNLAFQQVFFNVNDTTIESITLSLDTVSYETSLQDYKADIIFNPTLVTYVNATFQFNNTNYTAKVENISTGAQRFETWIQSPLVAANATKTFNPLVEIHFANGSIGYNYTTSQDQTIALIDLAVCDASVNTQRFLNISFIDEDTGKLINGTIVDSTFYYSLNETLIPINKTLSYSNAADLVNHTFCFSPGYKTIYTDISIDYDSEAYPQRNYKNTLTLTNGTTNLSLYILRSSEGIYVTYQVLTSAGTPLENVFVLLERLVSGTYQTISSGYTDAAGAMTFWLNPDNTYRLTFTKGGYTTYSIIHKPTQSLYTVSLSTSIATETNYNIGMFYEITPSQSVLNNNTEYNFSFKVTSSYFVLQKAGFDLSNGSDTVGSAYCSLPSGCVASTTINVLNYTNISMAYYWKVNDTHSNGTEIWVIRSIYTGDSSLSNFFNDFEKLGSGWDGFTKGLFAFFILIIVVGSVVYATGYTQPVAVLGMIVAVTGLLETVNFIPQIPGVKISYFTTIMMSIIFIGYVLYEYTR